MTRGQERELHAAAWLEWRCAKSCSTGEMPDPDFGPEMGRPPAWFVLFELGVAEGPSLTWTCESLGKTNRRALEMLGIDAPRKVTWPRCA